MGIKETKDVVVAVAKFGNAAGDALEDGKISLADMVHLYAPLMALGAAAEGADQIPGELADLDTTELADLQATFVQEFDIPHDGVEAIVEKAVAAAGKLVELFLAFRDKPKARMS
jgi:hypothetical protein